MYDRVGYTAKELLQLLGRLGTSDSTDICDHRGSIPGSPFLTKKLKVSYTKTSLSTTVQ